MATSKPKFNKFITGAVTAAMVATAVVPVASAATDVKFSDVPATDTHYANINQAAELGLFKGYTDGTFKPYNTLTRANVAKVLANYVVGQEGFKGADRFTDYVAQHDLVKEVTPFADVSSDHSDKELYEASLIVKDSGIFTGSNNNLMPVKPIQRQQLAKVLVNAFDLKDLEDKTSEVTDNDRAYDEFIPYIDILSENGVTEVKNFRPSETVLRGQMASFLNRAYAIEHGETQDPVITDYTLELSAGKNTLGADGADNTVITAKILDAKGALATDADDIVLKFDASHGTLANSRVTVDKGVATVVLTSEFSNKDVTSYVSARLIEAGPDSKWHEQIGNLVGETTLKFSPVIAESDGIEITGAESNQAERLTVYFNKAVTPSMFYDEQIDLGISQLGETQRVEVGYKAVKGNTNAIEVILAKDTPLTDNKKVTVQQFIAAGNILEKSFNLTDARQPEATKVEPVAYNMLKVTFSEPIVDVNLDQVLIDGGQVKITDLDNGEFYPSTGLDERHILYVTTEKFIKPGDHSISLSGIKDYAAMSDDANISTNQTLGFTVVGNNTVPAATTVVESPEQVRVQFNTYVEGFTSDDIKFEIYDEEAKVWRTPSVGGDSPFVKVPEWTVTPAADSSYVFELVEDWTQYFDTKETKDNYYNHQFRFVLAEEAVTNPANDLKNAKQDLSLNYSGSVLNKPDTTSPTIDSTTVEKYLGKDHYLVKFSEPVKVPGLDVNDTPSQSQEESDKGVPNVIVEFIGTDANGKKVTVDGKVEAYGDSKDNSLFVSPGVEAIQKLVDDNGYATDWQLVVRNVSDDVGNAAATLTNNFTVKPAVANTFKLDTKFDENGVKFFDGETKDYVELHFTAGVTVSGNVENALDLSNYTLNGQSLPKGSIARLFDKDNSTKNGYEVVIIELPNNTITEQSNIVNISKALKSVTGMKITGPTEVGDTVLVEGVPTYISGVTPPTTPVVKPNVVDEPITNTWSVSVREDELPESLQGGESYTITVDGKTYELTKNKFDANVFNGQVSKEHTKEVVENGTIKKISAPSAVVSAVNGNVVKEPITNTWSVSFKHDALPISLQGAESYTITVGSDTYELTKNKFDSNVFNGQVSLKHDEADVKVGIIKKK